MGNKADILAELQEISPLIAQAERVNPYTVPQQYFADLTGQCMETVHIDAILSKGKKATYSVPENYFTGLANNILTGIKTHTDTRSEIREELAAIAPLLADISKTQLYTVPAAYFKQTDFAELVTRNQKRAVIFNMKSARKWMQFAAAAMITGVLVMGAFMFTDNSSNLRNENYDRLDVSSELNKVSVDDLAEYLNSPTTFIAAPAATPLASEDELVDVKTNIQQFSDEELTRYVKENAEPYDILVSEKDN